MIIGSNKHPITFLFPESHRVIIEMDAGVQTVVERPKQQIKVKGDGEKVAQNDKG